MKERIIEMNGFERRSAKKREQILQTALEIMNHPNGRDSVRAAMRGIHWWRLPQGKSPGVVRRCSVPS